MSRVVLVSMVARTSPDGPFAVGGPQPARSACAVAAPVRAACTARGPAAAGAGAET